MSHDGGVIFGKFWIMLMYTSTREDITYLVACMLQYSQCIIMLNMWRYFFLVVWWKKGVKPEDERSIFLFSFLVAAKMYLLHSLLYYKKTQTTHFTFFFAFTANNPSQLPFSLLNLESVCYYLFIYCLKMCL